MSSLVQKLLKPPPKSTRAEMPHFSRDYPKNYFHQADLLYLPHDQGYKYLLVVVDIGTRLCDAEPLKGKNAKDVVKAIKKIYSRKVLSTPKKIYVDSGTEFKSDFVKWLDDNDIKYRVSKPFRHRQTALVEYKNKIIGRKLFERMLEEEILTGEESSQWVDYLPKVIKDINKKITKDNKIREKKPKKTKMFPCSGDDCILIPQETKVRVALDAPRDYLSGKRLHGKFRATDIRWDPKPKTITHTLINVNNPPFYHLDNDTSVAYTKKQLQIVTEDEKKPAPQAIQPAKKIKNQDAYKVEKIVGKKKQKGKIMYLVKWVGFPSDDNTWEPKKILLEDVPELVKKYEEDN